MFGVSQWLTGCLLCTGVETRRTATVLKGGGRGNQPGRVECAQAYVPPALVFLQAPAEVFVPTGKCG